MLKAETANVMFNQGVYSKQAARAASAEGVPEPMLPHGEAPAAALPEPSTDGQTISIQQIALAAHIARDIPPGMEPGLTATFFFEPTNFTFPFGTHIAVVEIDRETGDVKFLRYVAVDDCGKVINPLLVEGQIHGGIAQSIGQALYEEVVYDEQGQLMTGTLMDYALPKASMTPRFELDRTETPSPVNPLGIKGVGEAGTIGATPAIVNAIVDALSPYGVRHLDMPVRPESVWKIINQQG
jgi:carbon-monoxide dehydrogenase large subunit